MASMQSAWKQCLHSGLLLSISLGLYSDKNIGHVIGLRKTPSFSQKTSQTRLDDCTLTTVAPTEDNHLPHYGYPGFDLSCSSNTTATLLNLPYSVKVLVTNIDYETQSIHIKDSNSCSPQQLQNLNCYHYSLSICRFPAQFSYIQLPCRETWFSELWLLPQWQCSCHVRGDDYPVSTPRN